ncbi:Hypothetical predicted protein [Marmota monax]|uniref:Uncharacterized protein n=1 Tax=Marmota monax TaxID=9995 RepID=A0A5E4BHT7_MARMO|nr:Hypothetical predicted protein [Marmota monax]
MTRESSSRRALLFSCPRPVSPVLLFGPGRPEKQRRFPGYKQESSGDQAGQCVHCFLIFETLGSGSLRTQLPSVLQLRKLKPEAGAAPVNHDASLPKVPFGQRSSLSVWKGQPVFTVLFQCYTCKIHLGNTTSQGEFTERLHLAELWSFVLKASGEVDKVMIYCFVRDIPKK